jgi:hypothetical protein
MISLRQIARALGGHVAGPRTVLCPGPNHTPRDRSLAVQLDPGAPDGFVCFSHCGDDWKQCRDHVRERLGLPQWTPGDEYRRRSIAPRHIRQWDFTSKDAEADDIPQTWTEDELGRISYAQGIWKQGVDPRSTLAEVYLRDHRKLDLPDELAYAVLRFHPRCSWRNEDSGETTCPALIVPFRLIDDNAITGIHRIALNKDGSKIGRRMLGVVKRAAVKLDVSNGDTLAISEGIESALAARQLGFKPVWALGSVGAISFFPILDHVKQLIVLGERDDASRDAFKICSRRWREAGKRVRIAMPEPGYKDFNDILIAEIAEKTAS